MEVLEEDTPLDTNNFTKLVSFLRKHNLAKTEQILSREATELNIGEGPSSPFVENVVNLNNEAIMNEMQNLVKHIENALDTYKVELSIILFPVFSHLYIQAVRAGRQSFANQLYKKFHKTVPYFYKDIVEELVLVNSPVQAQTSELVKTLLENPFLLKLTRPVLKKLDVFFAKNPNIREIVSEHVTLEAVDQPIHVQSAIASELGGLIGQRSKNEKKIRMFYGIQREDLLNFAGDKKRLRSKEAKESKKKDTSAPQIDRIPLPALPEQVKQERRVALRDSQQRKAKITTENPPSVCLYTVLNANNGLCCASISENCAMLALGFGNGKIRINALMNDDLKVLKPAGELEQLDNDLDEFCDDMYIKNATPIKSFDLAGHSAAVHSVSFSCERRLMLSGSLDSTIRLWNMEMQNTLVIYRPMSPVWQTQFCNRSYYFATSTADHAVSLWSTDRMHPIRVFADALSDVTCIDFHPNCNYIVGGSDDRYVRVWDVLNGQCVRTFSGHKGAVKSVKTSPCGRYVVSASEEGQIAVWDLAQQRLMGTQKCEPFEHQAPIVFTRDGSMFVMGTPNHGLTFFSMDTMTMNPVGSLGGGGLGGASQTSTLSSDAANEPKINPPGFSVFSYPTKLTTILDVHFVRKNTLVAVGVYDQ